jgi:hypothetical protein
VDLKPRDVLRQYSKTVYYTMTILAFVTISIVVSLNMIKKLIIDYHAAQSLSLISLAISVIWHFCLFWQHFVFVGMGSYYEFLRFPACGYFLQSFVFQMRLIQEVFKVHYQDMQSNSAAVKRKLAVLYCSIYACFVSFFVY